MIEHDFTEGELFAAFRRGMADEDAAALAMLCIQAGSDGDWNSDTLLLLAACAPEWSQRVERLLAVEHVLHGDDWLREWRAQRDHLRRQLELD